MRATWPALDAALQAAAGAGREAPAGFAVQAAKRGTLDLALDHLLAAGAAAGRRDRAAGRRRALRQPGGRHRQVHAVPELRRRLPGGALADNPEKPQLRSSRRTACSAACAPPPARAGHHAAAAAVAGRRRRRARRRACCNEAEPYRCMRCGKPFGTLQAIEAMIGQAGRPPGLPGRGRRAAEDVRRLPRHRHPHQPERSAHHRPLSPTAPDHERHPPRP
jgi:hypothetical protein